MLRQGQKDQSKNGIPSANRLKIEGNEETVVLWIRVFGLLVQKHKGLKNIRKGERVHNRILIYLLTVFNNWYIRTLRLSRGYNGRSMHCTYSTI